MEAFLVYSGTALFILLFVVVIASNLSAAGKAAREKEIDTQSKSKKPHDRGRTLEYLGVRPSGLTSPSRRRR